jgi:RNA polymerase sigma factor (TIGR02999 family)
MTHPTNLSSDLTLKGKSRSSDLVPLVYDELRNLAAQKLAREKPGQTLQATALVHEAWLRLSVSGQQWDDQRHFFAAAAEAMRRVLIEHIRRKSTVKRGDNPLFEELHESRLEMRAPSEEIMAVHEALDGLAKEDLLAAEVVKLRYFIGMSIVEIGQTLEMSARTIDRHWAFARAWLEQAIERDLTNQPEETGI